MKLKSLMEKISPYAPLLGAVVIAVCVGISVKNYEAPVYAAEETQTEETESEEIPVVSSETETEEETQEEQETEAVTGSFDLSDGVYQGSAQGFRGKVTVSVQIQNKQITAIDILSASDDDAFFNRAKGVIDKIISSQSLDVDVVSGATYSSNGILGAVKNALTGETASQPTAGQTAVNTQTEAEQTTAGKVENPKGGYRDGTYYGTGKGFGGTLKVEVVISGGRIGSIRVVESQDDAAYLNRASALLDTMLDTQSTNVDTISGATYSSKGLISAVRNALKQAVITDTAESGTDSSQVSQTEPIPDDSTENTDTDSTGQVTGTIPYQDGIYYGTAEGYLGDITTAVVLQDQTIKAILVTEESDDDAFFTRASDVLKEIMKKQNTEVDVVSGATYSSNGLIGAVKDALAQADKATRGERLVDTSVLEQNVSQAEKLLAQEKNYTAASWIRFSLRLSDAKEVLADEAATEKEVSTALDRLKTAVKKLEKAPAQSSGNSGNNSNGSSDNGSNGSGNSSDSDKNNSDSGSGSTEQPKNVFADGTYTVSVPCLPDSDEDFEGYNLSLKLTVKNDEITEITDITGDGDSGNASYIKKAADGTKKYTGVVKQLTELGTLDAQSQTSLDGRINVVSGATCSSNAIIEACKKALGEAQNR